MAWVLTYRGSKNKHMPALYKHSTHGDKRIQPILSHLPERFLNASREIFLQEDRKELTISKRNPKTAVGYRAAEHFRHR